MPKQKEKSDLRFQVVDFDNLKDFNVPPDLVNQLYELTGDVERYKGVLFAFATEKGSVNIFEKGDSPITVLALRNSMGSFLRQKNGEQTF